MKYEDIELSGSLDISGSFQVPYGPTAQMEDTSSIVSGTMFYNTESGSLYVWEGEWQVMGSQSAAVAATGPASADIEYLVVGGGAGIGGNNNGYYGGGGGAGGFLSSSLSSIESGSSITVTVGAGSAAGNPSSNGSDSSIASAVGTSFTTVTAEGGGGSYYISPNNGLDGGSGGGAPGNDVAATGGSGTVGQGHDGGSHGAPGGSGAGAGSGGGGAGGPGQDRPSNGVGGNGGLPSGSDITGTTVYYAGGGGGGEGWSGFWSPVGKGTYGTNFTGGANSGGGGSYHNGNADTGDSGVVILAYDSGSINGAGGIIGDAGNGRKYHQFNTAGTFKAGSTSDFGIVTSSLVAHYDAGDYRSRGSSTWTDLTGTSNGSVTNATLGQNFYYSFDGSGDYIDLGSIDTFSDGEYTMEAWCKVPAFSSPALMSIFTLQDNIYAYIFIYADGSFRLNTETSNGTANLYTSTGYDDGNWHHVVATYTPGLLSAYVDNTADGTNTSGTGNPNSMDGWSLVGGYDSSKAGLSQSYPLLGDVAQIRVYNKALSASEISQNYNATKTNFV